MLSYFQKAHPTEFNKLRQQLENLWMEFLNQHNITNCYDLSSYLAAEVSVEEKVDGLEY